jgi:hypothetical protein
MTNISRKYRKRYLRKNSSRRRNKTAKRDVINQRKRMTVKMKGGRFWSKGDKKSKDGPPNWNCKCKDLASYSFQPVTVPVSSPPPVLSPLLGVPHAIASAASAAATSVILQGVGQQQSLPPFSQFPQFQQQQSLPQFPQVQPQFPPQQSLPPFSQFPPQQSLPQFQSPQQLELNIQNTKDKIRQLEQKMRLEHNMSILGDLENEQIQLRQQLDASLREQQHSIQSESQPYRSIPHLHSSFEGDSRKLFTPPSRVNHMERSSLRVPLPHVNPSQFEPVPEKTDGASPTPPPLAEYMRSNITNEMIDVRGNKYFISESYKGKLHYGLRKGEQISKIDGIPASSSNIHLLFTGDRDKETILTLTNNRIQTEGGFHNNHRSSRKIKITYEIRIPHPE